MSVFYPQAVMTLRIIFEDFKPGSDAEKAETYEMTILPSSVTVNINDYRTADTFTATVEYRHFPFDPRTIRSMGVTIHMQDMGKLSYGDDRMKLTPENTVFIGFADESSMELDDDSREVTFTGRDQTALFLDAQWDGSLVKLDKLRVDDIIRSVKDRLKSATAIEVDDRTDQKLPTLAGVAGKTLGGKRNASADESYWDVIQDVAGRAGLIAYMELDKIVLNLPHGLYKKEHASQFIYGRNLSSLKMTRKIGRMKEVNIRLLSTNHRADPPVIEIFIPKDSTASFRKRMKLPADHLRVEKVRESKKKDKTAAIPTAGDIAAGAKDEREIAPVITFKIANVASKARLVTIGEEIFETMSRQQIEGSFETKEMAVRDGNGLELNLLILRIGSPIEIMIDNEDLTGIRDIDDEMDRIDFLMKRGYDRNVAKALGKAIGGYQSPFFTKAVSFKSSANGEFSVSVEFINFIELKDSLLKGDSK